MTAKIYFFWISDKIYTRKIGFVDFWHDVANKYIKKHHVKHVLLGRDDCNKLPLVFIIF